MGYYFVLCQYQSLQKKAIKAKILSLLKDEEMEILSLDNNKDICWEEEGKEFLFNGEMYDVVKIRTVDGKLLLYCLNDKKEKALIDNYNLITKHNSSSNKKGKTNIDNSFNLFVITNDNSSDLYTAYIHEYPSTLNTRLPEFLKTKIFSPPKI